MEYTTNYNLKKPGDQDNVLVGDLNENMDTVDATMKALSDGKANLDPDTGKVEESELPEFLKLIGGTMKGAIQMANFLVRGLPDPKEDGDAARKAYVDAQVATRARLVTGSYQGNQQNLLILTFGFRPKTVFIWEITRTLLPYNIGTQCLFFGQSSESENSVSGFTYKRMFTVNDTGITISGTNSYDAMNQNNTEYVYAAFG